MIEEGKLMDNIGEILKNTRLDKGLSLEQVEEATSIRKIYLRLLKQVTTLKFQVMFLLKE